MNIKYKPLVSIIIPTYNYGEFITEALECSLQQTYENKEIIVVDDGSNDNTNEIVSSYKNKIRYFYQHNKGAPTARNQGVKLAKGDFITFLDADDTTPQDKLEILMEYLLENSSVYIVFGQTMRLKLSKYIDGKPHFEEFESPNYRKSLPSSIIRKSLFDKIGVFNESLHYCDDSDWIMRAQEMGITMRFIPKLTLYYRRHHRNITNQIEKGNHYSIRMIKKSLDRRRNKSVS